MGSGALGALQGYVGTNNVDAVGSLTWTQLVIAVTGAR
jgi:hypothetical protein